MANREWKTHKVAEIVVGSIILTAVCSVILTLSFISFTYQNNSGHADCPTVQMNNETFKSKFIEMSKAAKNYCKKTGYGSGFLYYEFYPTEDVIVICSSGSNPSYPIDILEKP